MLEAQILGGVLMVGALVVGLVWPLAGEWSRTTQPSAPCQPLYLHRRR